MKQIGEWLESKGQLYAQGVALYETHGKSRVVLNVLRHGESEFTRQKLRQELTKLVEAAGPPPAVAPRPAPSAPGRAAVPLASPKPAPAADVPSVPLEVVAARSSWYATRAYAHAQLELVPTEAACRELAATILAVTKKLDASYHAVEAPPADVAPEPELAALDDAGEIRRLLANLKPQRSKLRNRPDRAGDLARVVAQITLLETKLKNRDGEPQLHPRN